MIEIVYLAPDEQLPQFNDDEPWLFIEASDDGRFFGTGEGRNVAGENVVYASSPANDGSIDRAINAAKRWAAHRGVKRIWIQTTPWKA